MYVQRLKPGFVTCLTILILIILLLETSIACKRENIQFGDSRVISVDMRQAFGFGSMRGHSPLPLKDKEVVLTFDDGPWHGTTPKILKVLDKYCSHAIFFPIGKHVKRFPKLMRRVQQAGHTIGSHTWSHSYPLMGGNEKAALEDIMHGARVIAKTADIPLPRFFRYPGFKERKIINAHIRKRKFVVFSSDIDSVDWRMKSARALIDRVMTLLKKKRKGILILHDNKKLTAATLDTLLALLKRNGYKIVHVKTKAMIRLAEAQKFIAAARQKAAAAKPLPFDQQLKIVDQFYTARSFLLPSPLSLVSVSVNKPALRNLASHRNQMTIGLLLLLLWLSFKVIIVSPSGVSCCNKSWRDMFR